MRITLLAALLLASGPTLADRALERVEETYGLSDGGSISIENVNGDIDIEAWDSAEISLSYTIYGDDEDDLDNIKVRISSDPDYFRVETVHEKSRGWWGNNNRGSVDYTLRVPANADLRGIDTVNGDVRITGARGSVNAETVNGGLEVKGLMADARLSTVNGSIEAYFDRFERDQRVSLESVNGRLEVYIPENADVEVKAETVNGSLRNDFGLPVDKGFVGKDLRGRIGDGNARLTLDTVNGAINIRER